MKMWKYENVKMRKFEMEKYGNEKIKVLLMG
jgi:hypothetical protein